MACVTLVTKVSALCLQVSTQGRQLSIKLLFMHPQLTRPNQPTTTFLPTGAIGRMTKLALSRKIGQINTELMNALPQLQLRRQEDVQVAAAAHGVTLP